MELVKKFILEKVAKKELSPDQAKKLLEELSSENRVIEDDIAIVGISGKFPKASNVEEFWENLKNGVNCIQEWPEKRREDFVHILKNPHYTELLFGESIPVDEVEEGMYVKGGYLEEIDKFDYDFFGIAKREARYMDPRQRLILETVWEAIEDAGYGGDKIKGTKTGVFIGKENTNFTLYKFGTDPDPMHLTGGWVSIHASRISYMYNLTGPCMIVDTACSSGLSSVHVAMKSIKNGECDMAIAGAINTSLNGQFKNHKEIVDLSSVQSDDMLVRTFDKSANGTVWGEGVSMVILKPLKKALEDRDNIHAIINGSAMNNDGASNGITAPNSIAQEKVIDDAWKDAGIKPETVSYIEAHGTGTVLGDPIEIKGLTKSFRKNTDKKQFCAISSLKTNMGHLVACSGMASLTKIVMSLKNRQIAPTINFEQPNPYIDFIDSPLYINERLSDWKVDGIPRRAGASSFGFSGTNVHMIFEEYVAKAKSENENKKPAYCLTISAKKEHLLKDYVASYKTFFDKGTTETLEDICYTSSTGRGHYGCRLAIVAASVEELKEKINKINDSDLDNLTVPGAYYGMFKVIKGNKPKQEKWEISASQKKDKTELASYKAKHLIDTNDDYVQTLKELCVLYVNSADINWEAFYQKEKCTKVSLPVYPLERLRCWADPKVSKVISSQGKSINHPLLDVVLAESVNANIYLTTFKVEDKFWVLTDHKIAQNPVIPGTTYLEMVHHLGGLIFGTDQLEFTDIIFLTPMLVQMEEEKEVHTTFEILKNGRYKFSVASKNNDLWIKHVEGEIGEHASVPALFDREKILEHCTRIREGEELKVVSDVFQFGPRWNTVRKACHGENDVFITLELLDEIKEDVEEYYLHPSLLDNAVNILSQSFGEGTYLPLNYKSFKVYKPLPSTLFSYVKKKENSAKNLEVITFDIVLLDENDNVLGEIFDYSIKRVHDTGQTFKNLSGGKENYHEIVWKQESLVKTKGASTGNYLFITKESERENQLIEAYSKAGSTIYTAVIGDGFEKIEDRKFKVDLSETGIERLLSALKETTFDHIILSQALINVKDIDSEEVLRNRMNDGVYAMFHLVKSILSHKTKIEGSVTILSQNTVSITDTEKCSNPFDATLLGLSQVISREYQNLTFRAIDIEKNTSITELINEVESAENSITVLRDGQRYVKELKAVNLQTENELKVQEKGTYLVTGGTGGLGLEISKFIAKQANVNLVMINRSELPEKDKWEEYLNTGESTKVKEKLEHLLEIESMGSSVTCYSADVSNLTEMKAVFEDISKHSGVVNGIIHAAGVAGDGFLMNKNIDVFKEVIRPKVEGTWVLNELTKDQELDLFVLFSSIATMTGTPGQGDYTAANVFLNAFAEYRKEAVAINWPGWLEVGMAADFEVTDEHTLIHSIKVDEALNYFKAIIESGENVVIPGTLNFDFLSKVESNIDFSLSTKLKGKLEKYKRNNSTSATSEKKQQKTTNVQVDIRGKSQEELSQVESNLALIWANVLGADEIDVYDSFQELGGDSILATHLLKAIEEIYPGAIDISDIFSYPTIEQMAEYIEGNTDAKEEIVAKEESKDLDEMLENVLNDESSIDSILDVLGE